MDTRTDICRAFEKAGFYMLYQPVVDLATSRPVGVEALMRLKSASGKTIPPSRFIPRFERHPHLMRALTRFALEVATRDCALWQSEHGLDLHVACNVSPQQLGLGQLERDVDDALRRSGLPPSKLHIEITEGQPIAKERTREANGELLRLRQRWGVGVLLDDFPTAAATLMAIRDLGPCLTAVKLDQVIVRGVLIEGGPDQAIAKAVVAMARQLRIAVVAEGIETTAAAQWLAEAGVGLAQGFLFAPPLNAADVVAWALRPTPVAVEIALDFE